jgi:hypothetical protein
MAGMRPAEHCGLSNLAPGAETGIASRADEGKPMGSPQTDREARLKAALRDNLKKRKAREREAEAKSERGAESAGDD